MAKYLILAQAQRHIREIRHYTAVNWGRDQAKSYMQGMTEIFRFLTANPDAGRNCDDELEPGIMRFIYESHFIYYRKTSAGIAVIDILHQSMIPEQHLKL
jgi:toxin ParE1/3/4